jgi:hypothetical protein
MLQAPPERQPAATLSIAPPVQLLPTATPAILASFPGNAHGYA